MISLLPRRLQLFLASRRLLPESRRRMWEARWGDAQYAPPWETNRLEVVLQAVEDGWWPPGATLLDIGCGDGATAHALAGAGMRVTAVDWSPSAIARARARASAAGRAPRFEICDISREQPRGGPFAALLDFGCFHAMPERQMRGYASSVAAVSLAGARLLLVAPIRGAGLPRSRRQTRAEVEASIATHLGADFVFQRSVPFCGTAASADGSRLLLAFLERRAGH